MKTLCGAGVPVWESLKVALQLLKFSKVALDDRFGAWDTVAVPVPTAANIQACVAALDAVSGVGLTVVALLRLIDLDTDQNGFNSRH